MKLYKWCKITTSLIWLLHWLDIERRKKKKKKTLELRQQQRAQTKHVTPTQFLVKSYSG